MKELALMSRPRVPLFIDGSWILSQSETWAPVYNPSTGEVIATSPDCTPEEVSRAVAAARAAFPSWSQRPAVERVQYLFKLKQLLDQNLHELATILATENGKTHAEAVGSVARGIEIVEFACGMPTLMMGESLAQVSREVDVITYRVPLGVCAGICPFNFPFMIPLWMFPIAIAAGNTFVLKANGKCPNSAKRLMELVEETGLPKGVVNMVLCEKDGTTALIEHPDVKAISFVGSTRIGRIVYEKAARAGKRAQALCQAKNHALVLPDCAFEPTVKGIVNAAFGCAGERCMALPVAVVHEAIADKLVPELVKYASRVKVGPSESEGIEMGPLVTPEHLRRVTEYINKGVAEGAQFDDVIGVMAAYDRHPKGGGIYPPRSADLPYRIMLPQNVENLVVASGKTASTNPRGLVRSEVRCYLLGQGGGVAAAVAARSGTTARGVDIEEVQKELLKQNVYLGEPDRLAELGLA